MVQLDNDITVKPLLPVAMEQVVELSIVLTGEMYSDNLDDPGSLQYQTLSRQLADKVRHPRSFGENVDAVLCNDMIPTKWCDLRMSARKSKKKEGFLQ